jgi:hypothetical protein
LHNFCDVSAAKPTADDGAAASRDAGCRLSGGVSSVGVRHVRSAGVDAARSLSAKRPWLAECRARYRVVSERVIDALVHLTGPAEDRFVRHREIVALVLGATGRPPIPSCCAAVIVARSSSSTASGRRRVTAGPPQPGLLAALGLGTGHASVAKSSAR